ncbi:MAG: hypothetical protein AB7K08_10725 [Microbacteriaceae bacterium]
MDPSTPLPAGADVTWVVIAALVTVAVIAIVVISLRRDRTSR